MPVLQDLDLQCGVTMRGSSQAGFGDQRGVPATWSWLRVLAGVSDHFPGTQSRGRGGWACTPVGTDPTVGLLPEKHTNSLSPHVLCSSVVSAAYRVWNVESAS